MQTEPHIDIPMPNGEPPVRCVVCYSSRAKRFTLRVRSLPYRVELVVPVGSALASAESFAKANAEWLSGQMARIKKQTEALPASEFVIPEFLDIPLTGERLQVQQKPIPNAAVLNGQYNRTEKTIVLEGCLQNPRINSKMMLSLLSEYAYPILENRLILKAKELGFSRFRVLVRPQRSRWGGCSSSGTVSLNTMLIFFPPELVDLVICHELCHKYYMNHSAQFKAKLTEICPNWRELDVRMKSYAKTLPFFLL